MEFVETIFTQMITTTYTLSLWLVNDSPGFGRRIWVVYFVTEVQVPAVDTFTLFLGEGRLVSDVFRMATLGQSSVLRTHTITPYGRRLGCLMNQRLSRLSDKLYGTSH